MIPNNDDGDEKQVVRDGHSSAPGGLEKVNSGFDYRLNDDKNGVHDSLNGALDHESEGKHRHGIGGVGFEMGYLPPDQRPGLPTELLTQLQLADPEIDDDTEAAEALRANATVKVGKVGKVARSVGAQSVRKVAKRLTLRGQSGNRRGKPPRIPPGMTISPMEAADAAILVVAEASKEDDDSVESALSGPHNQEIPAMSAEMHMPERHDADGSKFRAHTAQAHLDIKDIPLEVTAATMEAGRKLMGAIDPHNLLQLQRWRRKNKKGKKNKRKSYVKGKVIDGRHELYALSLAVMLGVRTSIARTNTILASSDRKKLLSPQDFMAEEKYEFSPKGSATTPPHKLSHTFKFKDYAPVAFAYLRRMFGVNEFDFLLSVCGNANFIEFISNAKSGQFFFYSSDGKYMIKTMTNAESKFLRRILPHYFRHCTQNPNTLITKFLGMYRVKLYHLRRNVKFVIMNSVYYTDKALQTFFDLKGSEIGREAKPGQDVLKDNDLRARLPMEAFNFAPDVRERLRAQVASDCDFLQRMQIMDYSMLIGIHHIPPRDPKVHMGGAGFRISERQHSGRASQGSDAMKHAAACVKDQDRNVGFNVKSDQSVGSHSRTNSLEGDTRRLISDIRETTFGGKNFEFAGLFEEEDDCSFLEGSERQKEHEKTKNPNKFHKTAHDDIELKKEQTVEQIYWPFHRFYDINGFRRLFPRASTCEGDQTMIRVWNIPDFVPPLSDRKDGGIMMDTEGLSMPMTWMGPQGERLYEGKIYYMGIIDILQQYNARKRIETTYRRLESRGGPEPSCVSPLEYADRFVRFFDEYSAASRPDPREKNPEVEITLSSQQVTRTGEMNVQVSPSNMK